MHGAMPINTSIWQLSLQSRQDGLHLMGISGVVGLGALRSALFAGFSICRYTYVDRDPISRRIAKEVLNHLQQQTPISCHHQPPKLSTKDFHNQCPTSTAYSWTTSSQDMDQWTCWEDRGSARALAKLANNKVPWTRASNISTTSSASPLLYNLVNTYQREHCTTAVVKAGNMVQVFLGAPVLVDASDLGAAAHRVHLCIIF